MTKTSKTIVFFGSGPVAAASLKSLSADFDIEAIITKSSTMSEMQELSPDTVVHAADSKHALDAIFKSSTFTSKLGILIDYGVIISKDIINSFSLGIVNSHFSLLPEWRGADPITFSILSGQQQTGVSLMLVDEKMDEGPLLAQSPIAIEPGTTTPELTDQLVAVSNNMLKQIIPLYITGETQPAPQEDVTMASSKKPTYSRKLTKQDGILDWNKPAEELEREVRAFLGWPGSKTILADREVTITDVSVINQDGKPGVAIIENKQLIIHCGQKSLAIHKLKPAGKKEMPIQAFLAGYKNKIILE